MQQKPNHADDQRHDDEILLGRIGDALREEPNLLDDPRWDRLAAGELDEPGVAALKALADSDPAAAAAFEAFQPLDDAHPQLEALFQPRAEVVSIGRARGYRWAGAGAAVLAIAAALLLILRPGPGTPLARYELEVSRGEQSFRSAAVGVDADADADVVELTPASRIDLVLRPAIRVEGPIAVQAFLRSDAPDGPLTPLEVQAGMSPSGAIEIRGAVRDTITDTPGTYDLLLVVGREADLRELPDEVDALLAAHAPWQVFVLRLRISDE